MNMTTLGMFQMPGGPELLIILVIGLLLFGKRLPEVGRSVGKSIVEFKRGLKDIGDEVETESSKPGSAPKTIADEPGQSLPTGDARRVSQADAVEQSPGVEPQSNG